MAELLLAVGIVTVISFLLSLAETAIVAIPLHRAELLAKKYPNGAALVHLKKASEEAITTIVSISNLVTVGGSVITGIIAERLFGEHWIYLFAAVLTFVLMILGEIIPKRMAEQYVEPIALGSGPFLLFLSKLFFPLTFVITALLRPLIHKRGAYTSREEISYLAEIGSIEGALKDSERKMIKRVFKLANITAGDMMTPRTFLFMIDGKRTVGEAAREIMDCPYSRIPVYEGSPDKVIGIATQRKLLKALADGEQGRQVKDVAEEPLIIPEHRLGDDLLRDFKETKHSIGIVADGRGHVLGVVTLQDIAEELVGEVATEADVAPELVKRLAKNEIVAHGETQVGRINRFFNTEIPNHRTLCGFLLDEIGHLPKVGYVFKYQDLEFAIETVDHSLIEKVRIKKPE